MTPAQARILLCQLTAIRWGEAHPWTMYVKAMRRARTEHTRRKVFDARVVLGIESPL